VAGIKGEIEEIWKFNDQLGAKLKKSETMDHFEKDAKIQGWNWNLSRKKLNKIKSLKPIRNIIERNHKLKDQNDLSKMTMFWVNWEKLGIRITVKQKKLMWDWIWDSK
jgi:hypothetical protein